MRNVDYVPGCPETFPLQFPVVTIFRGEPSINEGINIIFDCTVSSVSELIIRWQGSAHTGRPFWPPLIAVVTLG